MLRIANKKALVVAISGGSGSGKTTIAHRLRQYMPEGVRSVVIYQDNYYKDQKDVPLSKRLNSNYDTPSAFDWKLMTRDLEALKNKRPVDSPVYDFTNQTRSELKEHIDPVDVVIFEGFMSLHSNIVHLSDIRIFVDTPSDERLLRRMMRDIKERNRSFESIANQWRTTVRPMYRAHVAPQKEVAHIIIPWYEISSVAIKAIKGSIMDFVNAPDDSITPYVPPADGFVSVDSEINASVEGAAHSGEELILLKHDVHPVANDGHGNRIPGGFANKAPNSPQSQPRQNQGQNNRFRRPQNTRQPNPNASSPAPVVTNTPLPTQPKPIPVNNQRPFQNARQQPSQRPANQQPRPQQPRPQQNRTPVSVVRTEPARNQGQPNQPNRQGTPAFKGQPSSSQGMNQSFRQTRPNSQTNKPKPVSPLTAKTGTDDDNGTDRGF